ncbi:hypothetical protein HGO23_11185 [Xenorhabdus budapestensis]|uniref:Uncharacterized protein n=1 Tax=Xenorhabdus budapestensis TaxID=290110 RepID=A0ABX7VHT9_XENBU|nr:hypothetical protein [Xenorhabdus budapestensis]QTL38478.1 hypothetical protein HGO23_11185 [Xenorhabdus budapestensis]
MLKAEKSICYDSIDLILSVKNGADIVIGQKFYLEILISSKNKIPDSLNIEIENQKGFEHIENIRGFSLLKDKKSAKMEVYCIVGDIDLLSPGDEISFTLSGIERVVKYYAKNLIKHTIQLYKDKKICITPSGRNQLSNNSDHYVRYYTRLFDTRGQLLRNTPIQIFSEIKDHIEKKVIITTDPRDSTQIPQRIIPFIHGDKIEVTVTSDNEGRIRFRVYAMRNKPVILELISKMEGVGHQYYSGNIYIITSSPIKEEYLLDEPYIFELSGEVLSGNGRKLFEVQIGSYTNSSITDSVLFFTKSKPNGSLDPEGLVLPVKKISDASNPGDNNYIFRMPRDIFPFRKNSEFYYVIAPIHGISQYSGKRTVRYIGNETNAPNKDVKRTYNIPTIFSSFADINNDPKLENSEKYIILNNENVNLEKISNYPISGYELYVKILGTNDENDPSYPIWGGNVYLRLYVKSNNKNFNQTLKFIVPNEPDKIAGKTSTIIVKFKYPEFNEIKSDPNTGAPGVIYFEYYTIDPSTQEKTYSHYWKSMIDTDSYE